MIDAATEADLPAVLALLERSGLPTDGAAEHLETMVVAREGGRVVGAAALEPYRDGALLRSVVVEREHQGQGLGEALTSAALNLASVPNVYLLTTTAEKFFPRFGFEPISRDDVPASVRESVEFVSACPSSAVVMRRKAPVW